MAKRERIKPGYRIRIQLDEDASFEECNGEDRPLTAEEYAENQYRGCPVHPRSKVPGKVKPGVPGQGLCGECGREFEDIPYEEYRAYYGNPNRHVYVGVTVEQACATCGHFEHKASVWGVDLMDDDPGLQGIDLYRKGGAVLSAEEALSLPGYLADVAREELIEAGAITSARWSA